jgi:uncharacterized protein (DUF433 family)
VFLPEPVAKLKLNNPNGGLGMPFNDVQAPSWIEKASGVCGGDARIRNTRHTVAGLVQWRRLGLTDSEILARHPDLSPADLATAWEYEKQHRDELDLAIRENEDA